MKNTPIKHIGIAYHPRIPEAKSFAEEVADFLRSKDAQVNIKTSLKDNRLVKAIDSKKFEALIVLGGDGSMLRASLLCAHAGIPITGINLGTFGFLFEVHKTNWQRYVERLLSGNYRIENRMMLKAELYRDEKLVDCWHVVNEVVISRGKEVRPIRIHAKVDKYPMASYVADGLIASTATGSTAYALAVNGPIMPPETRNILVVPVAPHLSFDRAVILSEGSCVTIEVDAIVDAVLSADGRDPIAVLNDDTIRVQASDRNASFIRFHGPGFFYRNLNRYMKQNPSI